VYPLRSCSTGTVGTKGQSMARNFSSNFLVPPTDRRIVSYGLEASSWTTHRVRRWVVPGLAVWRCQTCAVPCAS
jgi:hypothetical protein